jgi:plasmid stabilization system protein ParE
VKVLWSDRARTRLSELYNYVHDRAPLRAGPLLQRIVSRAEQLEIAPRSGRLLAAFADDEVRELLEPPIRIVYRVCASQVEILTVKHYRQRLTDRPSGF